MGTLSKAFPSNLTLTERRKLKKTHGDVALLLDTSGSMSLEVEPGHRRIDALKQVVKDLTFHGRTFAFDADVREIDTQSIPGPNGGTYVGRALRHMKEQNISRIVLITDGEPSDYTDALEACTGLSINIIYVGSGNRPRFLDELAAKSGNIASTESLLQANIKELTTKVQLLLTDGTKTNGTDIQL